MPSQTSPALALQPAAARVHEKGELAARTILGQWKGPALADACVAALQLGLLNAGSLLAYHRCRQLLEANLDLHKVNKDRWPEALSVFHQGRDTIITRSEVWARYIPNPAERGAVPFFEPTVFEWKDPATIPVRDWIYGRHLIRRHVSATIASGAVGKTSLKIVEALALATGRPLLGLDVPKRSRVWLFNLEDDKVELQRRVSAAIIHYRIKPEDLGDRLMIDGEKSLVITTTTRVGTVINEPVVDAIVQAIQAREIDVL